MTNEIAEAAVADASSGVGTRIDIQTAEREFDRFLNLMDIDASPDRMDDDDAKAFQTQKARIVRAIQNGSLEITDDGEPIFTPRRSENRDSIHFREPTGANLMAMDRKKKSEDIKKMYALMGEISRTSSGRFASMAISDLNVCIAVTSLFLG